MVEGFDGCGSSNGHEYRSGDGTVGYAERTGTPETREFAGDSEFKHRRNYKSIDTPAEDVVYFRVMGKRGLVLGMVLAAVVTGSVARAQEDIDYQKPNTWRPTIKATIKDMRTQLLELRARQKEELRMKMGQIKDVRKKTLVERIGNRMCDTNTRLTNNMKRYLENLSRILDRVEARMQKARDAGENVVGAEEKIAAARKAITDAKTAVDEQAVRPCTVTLASTESAVLKTEVKNSIAGLEVQLKGVRTKVKEARQAVTAAIVALAQVLGEKVESVPTIQP
ncbi:MAG: hypothetical protein UY33_C0039G0012 [Candidatus Amesbacteria bacterium GW2011_GWA1_48_9]|uniref:Uncharacterized protein n=2 Tax=Candidatus Amesiibacteriota TaxID=1752730 RepID=A0A0G1X8U1_9BACT|nr:MAG: hypothetical protein UY22_C0049G0005 [Candidatus Amesbacteria bacterium GW2011_GWC1_48_10]KKU99008.1 MAG: hypothetical protein UY33_C0039G0012 [Candidatus Amesbacteria bacterium GW2011_GWA1_48_9]